MSNERLLFAPRTVNALGVLLLIGILMQLLAWAIDMPQLRTIGLGLCVPFLAMLAILILIVLPCTWLRSRRSR